MTRLDLLAAAASASVTLIVVPIVRHAGLRAGLTDPPGPLKIHSRPTPRLGGIALFFAMLAGVTVAQRAGLSFLVALLAVWLVGLLDDIVGASASLRLSVQFVAAALLWFDGWRIPIPVATLPVIENALSLVATGLFVVFTINAFNLIDGADGIATGIAASIAGAYILLPLASLGALGFAAAAALFGATTAFLVFNLPPAKIFLGDSGSTLLGLTIAYLGLDFCRSLSLSFIRSVPDHRRGLPDSRRAPCHRAPRPPWLVPLLRRSISFLRPPARPRLVPSRHRRRLLCDQSHFYPSRLAHHRAGNPSSAARLAHRRNRRRLLHTRHPPRLPAPHAQPLLVSAPRCFHSSFPPRFLPPDGRAPPCASTPRC